MISTKFKTILVIMITLKLQYHLALANGRTFYGGSMSFSVEKDAHDNFMATIQLVTGWTLGSGPCGAGCSKSDIGKSTRSTRPKWQTLYPSTFGTFDSDFVNKTTDKTNKRDMDPIVNRSYNETVLAVSENDKWEQELLQFSFVMSHEMDPLDINFEGSSWRKLTLQKPSGFLSWHMQVSVSSALRSDTGAPNIPPRTLFKPVFRIKLGKVTEICIPAVDDEGDIIECEKAEYIRGGDLFVVPAPNAQVHKNCTVSINTSESSNYADDTWIAIPVTVSDYNRKAINYGQEIYQPGKFALSSSAVQFVVQVVANLASPEFVEPTPGCNHEFIMYAGATWRTDIFVEATPNTTIKNLTVTGSQGERFVISALHQDLKRPPVKYAALSWTYSKTEIGSHIACITVIDSTGIESAEQRCFLLHVRGDAFNHTTKDSSMKPYFVDIPSPDQFVSCERHTRCIIPLYIKSVVKVTYIHVTEGHVDYFHLSPLEVVTHKGEQMYQSDLSFEHSQPAKERLCFIATDKNGVRGDSVCVHIRIEYPDPCMSTPCLNSGICKKNIDTGGFTCICQPEASGKLCENLFDPCKPDPCDPTGSVVCIGQPSILCYCRPGYTGRTCSENIDDCRNDSCNGHGLCKDKVNAFDCDCFERYNGTRCQIDRCPAQPSGVTTCGKDIDPCNPNPCMQGTCFHHQTQYMCVCPSGFTGRNCELNLSNDPCMQTPCVRGTCFSHASQYTCVCPQGFTGKLCEKSDDTGTAIIG